MRFDSTVFTHVGESYPWDILMDEFRQTAKLLDEGGFSGIWIAEHHFAWDGWFRGATNPILLGADLATHAPNLRIGQCGVILPDWHPLRVAEDIAMLDNMTKGRVEFGIGRGINSRTSIQFNPDADRLDQKRNYALFTESLDVIIKAWTEEKFTYQGEFYTVPNPGWHEPNPANADPRYHATNGELTALGWSPSHTSNLTLPSGRWRTRRAPTNLPENEASTRCAFSIPWKRYVRPGQPTVTQHPRPGVASSASGKALQ